MSGESGAKLCFVFLGSFFVPRDSIMKHVVLIILTRIGFVIHSSIGEMF